MNKSQKHHKHVKNILTDQENSLHLDVQLRSFIGIEKIMVSIPDLYTPLKALLLSYWRITKIIEASPMLWRIKYSSKNIWQFDYGFVNHSCFLFPNGKWDDIRSLTASPSIHT